MRPLLVNIEDGGGGRYKEEDLPQYIDDQNEKSIADLPFGKKGTITANGCGMVALYNIMVASGKYQDSFKQFNEGYSDYPGIHLFGGTLGMNPIAMKNILYNEFGKSNVDNNILYSDTNYDAIVMLYVWKTNGKIGAHYYTAVAHSFGVYTLYNEGAGATTYDFNAFRSYALNQGFVVGSWGITFEQKGETP